MSLPGPGLRRFPALLLPLLFACDSGETTIRLRLAPNPQLNSERQILAVVESLALTLDAPVGFRGATAEAAPPGLALSDPDGDGLLELTLTHPLAGEEGLPVFRLRPGQNQDRVFQAAVRGLRGSEVAAIGALDSVRFYPDQTVDLMIPFDLRASYRPPRVVSTSPRDTQSGVPPAIARIEVEFSKLVEPRSLRDHLRIVYQGSAGDRLLHSGPWDVRPIEILELGLQTRRALAIFQIEAGCSLSPGRYRVEAAPGIRDTAGMGLDQDALREGPDPYLGHFIVAGPDPGKHAEACEVQARPCQTDPECNPSGGTVFVCQVGKCVPAATDCTSIKCPERYVCDSSGEPGTARCVEDCRLTGFCGGKTDYCGEDGLCHPCTPTSGNPKCGNMVSEEVICLFNGSVGLNSCKSVLGSCEGAGKCAVTISGLRDTPVTWSSDCGTAITKLDGISETAAFTCGSELVKDTVKCIFTGATTSQECYSSKGSCKGISACIVDVSGFKGEKVDWKSSCGGYLTTTIDGVADSAEFACAAPIKETVQCVFVNSTMEQTCYSAQASCKGVASCDAFVLAAPGLSLTWTSTCPGQVNTVVDGVAKTVKFYCK